MMDAKSREERCEEGESKIDEKVRDVTDCCVDVL